MKVDAEKGEGIRLAKKYNVRGYPTVVFVNNDSVEIDRIVGYYPPQPFLQELQRIHNGENTYLSLANQVQQTPDNITVLTQYAKKLEQRSSYSEEGLHTWQKVNNLADPGSQAQAEAGYKVAQYQAALQESAKPLETFIDAHPESPYLTDAYSDLTSVYKNLGEPQQEADAFKQAVEVAEKSGKVSAGFLNSYAWRMSELELNLNDALKRAKQAVEMVKDESPTDRAQIMDTEAEVRWKLGQDDKAIEITQQAIKLQPDDNYYKKQLAKFQGKPGNEAS